MGSDWKTSQLKYVLGLVADNRGRNPDSYSDQGIPVIDNYLIISEGYVDLNKVKRYIDEDTYESFIRKYIEHDDVLITLVGNGYGKVALAPFEKTIIIQNTVGLRCNEDNSNKYLYYLLKNNRNALMNLNIGAAQPSIKVGNLLALEFIFPSINEQKAIAHMLGSLDDKIELNRQMNETLESMAQALFKSWFVDFDPVIDNALAAGNPIPDVFAERAEQRRKLNANAKKTSISGGGLFNASENSYESLFPSEFEFTEEMGWIPKGWKIGIFSDIANENPESWTKKNSPETVLYVDLASTKNGRINHAEFYEYSNAPSRARRVLNIDDTIIGLVRPGNRSFAYIQKEGLTGSTGFAVMRPIKKEYRSFLYLGLTQDDVIDYFAHIADGAAYPAIRPEVVTNLECVIPSNKILELFDSLINPNLIKIGENEKQGSELAKLRDTLLPKLLSGELRIPDAEKLIEEVNV